MRILHTGDWHIGKLVNGLYMTQDQAYFLKAMCHLIEEEKIDVLLIAGDVYDRSIPPTGAVDLLDEVLSHLVVDLGVKVLAIAGNHDSPDRLNFGSKILRDQGLYISSHLEKNIRPLTLNDAFGPVNFYSIPYADPSVVRAVYEDDSIKNHDQAMGAIIDPILEDLKVDQRNICISHSFVVGSENPEESDSERPLSIGGTDYVSVDHYESFDYVALGHLHRPQRVKEDYIRYSGSLLKYSFSEAKQRKSLTLIDLGPKGDLKIDQVSLPPLRDMRVIRGNLDTLLSDECVTVGNPQDYIAAELTDRGALFEPMKKLRSKYPNALQLDRLDQEDQEERVLTAASQIKEKGPRVLIQEFFKALSGGLSQEMEEEIARVFDQVEKEERAK